MVNQVKIQLAEKFGRILGAGSANSPTAEGECVEPTWST